MTARHDNQTNSTQIPGHNILLSILALSPATICIINIIFTGWFEIVMGTLILLLIATSYFTKTQISKCLATGEEGLSLKESEKPSQTEEVLISS